MSFFTILDLLGTGVFAISGALAAMRQKFDLFGVLILGAVTAIGGGSLRDLLIGRTPVGWMQDINYSYAILAGVLIAVLFRTKLKHLRKTMFLFDAIGLGLFTIIGVEIALEHNINPVLAIFMGTMSASFGGVIRDVLSNQVPLIFKKEIYASISLLGGTLFYFLQKNAFSLDVIYIVTAAVVVVLRILAVKKHWVLPRFYREG